MKNENNILNEDEELKKMAPFLWGVNKQNPFKAPEDYFETLPQIIQEKCQTNAENKKWTWGSFTVYKPVMVVASVTVVLVIALFYVFVNPRRPIKENEAEYNSFVRDEGTLNDLSDVFDESTIIDAVLTGSSENVSDSAILEKDNLFMENPEYTKDDVINYLLEENSDMDNVTQ